MRGVLLVANEAIRFAVTASWTTAAEPFYQVIRTAPKIMHATMKTTKQVHVAILQYCMQLVKPHTAMFTLTGTCCKKYFHCLPSLC